MGAFLAWCVHRAGHCTRSEAKNGLISQVVCLGAGFDTTYFQLSSLGRLHHCRYFEVKGFVHLGATTPCYSMAVSVMCSLQVDLPGVIEKKTRIIETSPELSQLANTAKGSYQLLACDIVQTSKLEQLLEGRGIQWSVPTLILAEVVLTYIEPAG